MGIRTGGQIVVALPTLCECTDVQLAHELMRRHRGCRTDRCMWKAAAHHTLMLAGRLTPQSMSPRERAAARGIDFPAMEPDVPWGDVGPTNQTLREVLDKLSQLASPVHGTGTVRAGEA